VGAVLTAFDMTDQRRRRQRSIAGPLTFSAEAHVAGMGTAHQSGPAVGGKSPPPRNRRPCKDGAARLDGHLQSREVGSGLRHLAGIRANSRHVCKKRRRVELSWVPSQKPPLSGGPEL